MKNIEAYKATMFFAPPTVWIGMLRHPDFSTYDLSSLEKCYYGASIMPMEILKELMETFPKAQIYNYYGQTELAPYHTLLRAEDALEKIGSAGMAALHMESRLEDDEGNEIVLPDTPGEICGRGPHVMTMYFKEPEKTEEALRGNWFHSGDLGVIDQDRYITVVDRKKRGLQGSGRRHLPSSRCGGGGRGGRIPSQVGGSGDRGHQIEKRKKPDRSGAHGPLQKQSVVI